jgi:hypothetical protein
MTKKNWLLLALALGLGVIYVRYFTGWFRPPTIHIAHTSRNLRSRAQPANASPPLNFGLNQQYRLTEITVVPLAIWQTNPSVSPVWHLISDSNSVPVRVFSYGQGIRGMKPAVAGSRAQPLETNVAYRLFVIAGKAKGQHDFKVNPGNRSR